MDDSTSKEPTTSSDKMKVADQQIGQVANKQDDHDNPPRNLHSQTAQGPQVDTTQKQQMPFDSVTKHMDDIRQACLQVEGSAELADFLGALSLAEASFARLQEVTRLQREVAVHIAENAEGKE